MVMVRAARKAEALHSPILNSPRATATLKYLRRQLDIAAREETRVLDALTACRDTRVRIEQSIVALLKGEQCDRASTVKSSSTGK